MTADEFRSIYRLLQGAWPFAFPDDGGVFPLWASRLARHDAGLVRGSVNLWIDEHRKPPAIADVLDGVKASARKADDRPRRRFCGGCDHGWEWTDLTGVGTVTRCRNGCLPKLEGEVIEWDDGEVYVAPPVDERVLSIVKTIE